MIDPKGYIKSYRKAIGHPVIWDQVFGKFQAWSWLLMEARIRPEGCLNRGELIVGRRYLADKWKWSESKVTRFLKRLIDSEMISTRVVLRTELLLKVHTNSAFFDTKLRTDFTPKLTIVTILNYDKYNPSTNGADTNIDTDLRTYPDTNPDTNPDTVLKNVKNVKEHKNVPRKKRASHDREVLQGLLSEINMPDFERQYGPQGLDTFACFDDFTDYVLNGSAKDPRPNPANWTDFNRAFHDSCKRALRDGRHVCKLEAKKDLSLAERLAQRDWK